MKRKSHNKKILLNKKTIANINREELRDSRAGGAIFTEGTCTVDCNPGGKNNKINPKTQYAFCVLSVGHYCIDSYINVC